MFSNFYFSYWYSQYHWERRNWRSVSLPDLFQDFRQHWWTICSSEWTGTFRAQTNTQGTRISLLEERMYSVFQNSSSTSGSFPRNPCQMPNFVSIWLSHLQVQVYPVQPSIQKLRQTSTSLSFSSYSYSHKVQLLWSVLWLHCCPEKTCWVRSFWNWRIWQNKVLWLHEWKCRSHGQNSS